MKNLIRVFIVFLVVWAVARSAVHLLPGDPAEFLVHESLVRIDTEELRRKMDLDQSPWSRIFSLPGNRSLVRDEEMLPILLRAWGKTSILAILSLSFSIPLTFFLLFLQFRGGLGRNFSEAITFLFASIPIVILGPVLLRFLAAPNPLLPALTLSAFLTAFWYRTLARRIRQNLPSSPVDGARALGFSEFKIFTRSLLAPSLGGFIVFFGSQLGFLLNGSILVETLFQWNGIGSLLADAILSRDYPLIEMGMITAALFTLLAQQAGYAFQSWWDPRIS
jgi:peptide/nickel transport system permease protein